MRQKEKRPANYLDYIPARSTAYLWTQSETGAVVLEVPHTGFYDKLVQRFFHRPASSKVDLDELGSFIWLQMDGQRSIYEIALLVHRQFGEQAEPLLKRIITFFRMLQSYQLICFAGQQSTSSHKKTGPEGHIFC